MCGITGILQFQAEPNSEEKKHHVLARIKKMTDSIRHRGPDGEGLWSNPDGIVFFGHRRLSILDLSAAAAQPMSFLERYTLVYNGEIYNHVELRDELQHKGYSFHTRSDAEVLLAAFDFYKEACLQKLDGMFAFAIWDESEQSLFAARDRFGEKPFFYSIDENKFCFASEKKALWTAGLERKINHPLLLNYLVLGHTTTAADKTISFYQDIYSLPPAHYIRLNRNDASFRMERYWDCDKEAQQTISETAAIEQFRELIRLSVKRRLRMDVAVGSCLSGGLDSSSLAAIMQTMIQDKFMCFSAVFPGFAHDESDCINNMAKTFNLESVQINPDEKGLMEDFEKICYHQEEPFSSASIFAQYKVFESASAHGVKVLIDGQGADEVLAGYPKYIQWHLQQMLRAHPSAFLRERRALGKNKVTYPWGWKNYLAALVPAPVPGILEKREAKKILHSPDIHPEFRNAFFDRQSLCKPLVLKLNDILYFDSCQFGLEELLRYADRNSMANGLELRLPFLSHELVEFLFSLPAQFKIREGWTKWILRKSMDKMLPKEIVWRKDKVGFEPPQKSWMNAGPVRERIQDAKKILVKERILHAGVLNKKIQPQDAHAAENNDWRWLVAAAFISNNLFT